MGSSFLAIITGLFFVNLIKPGKGGVFKTSTQELKEFDFSFFDKLLEIVPENVFTAMSKGEILPVIFFSLLIGFFITKLPEEKGKVLRNFFDAGFELIMKLTMFIIKFAPIGIFGIIVKVSSENVDNMDKVAQTTIWYLITVLLALFFHAFISMPIILKLIGKINPIKHFKSMGVPLLTAFSTSSSAATLSLTMEAVENKAGVSNKISSFTLPLGATMNMDGTALYECVAAIFIAQLYGFDLSLTQQGMIVFIALLTSIGAAAIPMAGLFMISIILTAIGIPLDGVGLILVVDRIVDMFRTSVNVWSDTCGTVIIAKSEKEKIYDESKDL
jgi:Na+/H+-dicarboxylate symporter